MKKFSLLFLFLCLSVIVLGPQKPDKATHTLELLPPGATKPVQTEAFVYSKEGTKYISITFPDGLITTKIVDINGNQYKFQLSQIRNRGLVSIHFIGSGNIKEKISGKFKAMVDGVPREDMSGSFSIIKR